MKKCECYKEFDLQAPVCYGTLERDYCSCGGDESKCDFYEYVRERAMKKAKGIESKLRSIIYYAHHRWKYGTLVEEYEISLIKEKYPNMDIFNPSVDLKIEGLEEQEIMRECFNVIDDCNIVVFSSVDGIIGKGVFEEIKYAKSRGRLVLYMYRGELHECWTVLTRSNSLNDRLYANVYISDGNGGVY